MTACEYDRQIDNVKTLEPNAACQQATHTHLSLSLFLIQISAPHFTYATHNMKHFNFLIKAHILADGNILPAQTHRQCQTENHFNRTDPYNSRDAVFQQEASILLITTFHTIYIYLNVFTISFKYVTPVVHRHIQIIPGQTTQCNSIYFANFPKSSLNYSGTDYLKLSLRF